MSKKKLLCFFCFWVIMNSKIITAQNTQKYPVLIDLNIFDNAAYIGLPIKSKDSYMEFYISKAEKVTKKIFGGTIEMELSDSNYIYFRYISSKEKVDGQFIIPDCLFTRYDAQADPESFVSSISFGFIIRPYMYYVPYRAGVWNFEKRGKKVKKEYINKFILATDNN